MIGEKKGIVQIQLHCHGYQHETQIIENFLTFEKNIIKIQLYLNYVWSPLTQLRIK